MTQILGPKGCVADKREQTAALYEFQTVDPINLLPY
jgi:hypothetical protein